MDEAREYQELIASELADSNLLISFVGPKATYNAAVLTAVAWRQPPGWCLNVLIALGLDAVREKGLQGDPMPWMRDQMSDLKAEIDAQG